MPYVASACAEVIRKVIQPKSLSVNVYKKKFVSFKLLTKNTRSGLKHPIVMTHRI